MQSIYLTILKIKLAGLIQGEEQTRLQSQTLNHHKKRYSGENIEITYRYKYIY